MCYSVMVVQDLKKLRDRFGALPNESDFDFFEETSRSNPKKFKPLAENPRIYPGYYAPIIVSTTSPITLPSYSTAEQQVIQLPASTKRWIKPMRYRIRPHGSTEEVPSKYNVFNARLDALQSRHTWRSLLGRRHGLIVFERFFEWVTDKETGKKKVVSFSPKNHDLMWSPVLWDRWQSPDGKDKIDSFAIITTDPPPEVQQIGHDRCPIFLRHNLIEEWLNPQGKKPEELLKMLSQVESTYFEWALAA